VIESARIKNFRCFEEVSLSGLANTNIIVGSNASGKTAMLEALFMAATGHPMIAARLRGLRLLNESTLTLDRQGYEAVWRDFFFQFDQARIIHLTLSGSANNTRATRIYYAPEEEENVIVPMGGKPEDSTAVVPIQFEHSSGIGEPTKIRVMFGPDGLSVRGPGPSMVISSFPAGNRANPQEAAQRFSQLSVLGKDAFVIQSLKKLYPFITDVSLQMSGGIPALYASVTGIREKMPVSLVSDGVYRVMTYLLAMASYRNGVLLIDELENGLYYGTLAEVWRVIHEFASEYGTQLFVSTHSSECLRALLPTISGNEDKFTLIRTHKVKGSCEATVINGRDFQSAIEEEMEVR